MIKTLSKAQKMEREKFRIPRSVQDAIPIRRIFADGIFQVGNQYSKTWSFTDINYAIAGKEDKTSMFLDYSELLNALDSGASAKITIYNRRMHEKCNVNDFVERFGVSRRTITSDIVVLTRKHNIRSKSGPHGGIEIDRGLKTDEVPYLTDFETSWLKRKYDEAEIEEDRIAAHSILRRFSL